MKVGCIFYFIHCVEFSSASQFFPLHWVLGLEIMNGKNLIKESVSGKKVIAYFQQVLIVLLMPGTLVVCLVNVSEIPNIQVLFNFYFLPNL